MSDHIHLEIDNTHNNVKGRVTKYGGTSGGDGGNPVLEQRVQRLEQDVNEIRTDMKEVRDRLSRIEGKIGMLPGWGGLLSTAAFIIGAVGLMIRFMPLAG